MKYVKATGLVALAVAFIALIVALIWHANHRNVVEKEETVYGCEYFNGRLVEISEEYLVIEPTSDWKWDKASRVIIPVTPLGGAYDPEKVQAMLFEGDMSELKQGDMVRVAFNGMSMHQTGDEVRIGIVFKMFRWTDEASQDQPATVENPVTVSDAELSEIYDFMNYFMTFPVVWDFNQQSMSSAVDYFAQKWVWTDVTAMEYDAEAHAFYVNADDFAKEMGQYFVMSDSALKSIEARATQGRLEIWADKNLPWFWGFSFGIDRVEKKDGAYYVHGYNAEVTEKRARDDDILMLGGNTDPFLEFNAVVVRDDGDGKLRIKELDGLESGPGRKANVSQLSDADRKELADFASVYLSGPILEQYDLNDLSGVFDFAAQKILQMNPDVAWEMDDGRCIVPLSELLGFMEQHFYLPKGYEKCLPKEGEGKADQPYLTGDDVVFLPRESAKETGKLIDDDLKRVWWIISHKSAYGRMFRRWRNHLNWLSWQPCAARTEN